MHTLEPFYNWRSFYIASEDEKSPFFEREYSEFEFTEKIYNYLIHPQWDSIGSETLFIKILFTDYESGFTILELIGEWNDAINNDIMILKRDIIDHLIHYKVHKFILIGENILNFHGSDDCYYEEWFGDVEYGWITFINFREHVLQEMKKTNLDNYIIYGGILNKQIWRTLSPRLFFEKIESIIHQRLN
ncbi:MAG: hypothetical protein IT239_01485 [Bacteroidia bacterium]|nr:hypothetical protein [Bacteroidia bacterium]